MNHSTPYHRKVKQLTHCVAALCLFLVATSAQAFDELNEAQKLLFDSPHLVNTQNGQTISYSYRSEKDKEQPVDDVVTINITAQIDEERRDVDVEFLTDERHMILPPFKAYRGNPLMMAMLEHMVRKIAEDTGGGSLYFRNRLRDALASDNVLVEKQKISVEDGEVDATVLKFQALKNDPRLGSDSIYSQAIFTISLSDKVPGGIIGIGVKSEPDGQFAFSRELTLIK